MKLKSILLAAAILFPAVSFSQARTVPNHSVSAEVSFSPNLRYTYELPLGAKFTALIAGGVLGMYGDAGLGGGLGLYGPNIFLSVEPRFYYNLRRREQADRMTCLNSGDFVSLDIYPVLWPLFKRDIWIEKQIYISPAWGMRRVYGNFLLEMKAGLDINLFNGSPSPHLSVRLGYAF